MTTHARTLEATFRSTTPIFMAGAQARRLAEIRIAGVKGVLRFWWRAQAWMRWQDLGKVREQEAMIFGSTDAQSPVLFHLVPYQENSLPYGYRYQLDNPENGQNGEGLLYFGHGICERVDQAGAYNVRRGARSTELRLTRACLPSKLVFTIKMIVRPCENQAVIVQELEKALQLTGLLGGIGARTRRGFGSLTLIDLKGGEAPWVAPTNLEEFHACLHALNLFGAPEKPKTKKTSTRKKSADSDANSESDAQLPPYTAFSKHSRVLILQGNDGERPLEMLDRIGKEMIRYRSWGTKGTVLGARAEKNFRNDHNLMLSATRGQRVRDYPQRIAFGLPQAYFFSSLRAGTFVAPSGHGHGRGTDRRASPLFIHIHQPEENLPPIAVLTFLPAPFLAADDSIQIGKLTRVKFKNEDDFWQPVHGFLDRLQSAEKSVETFQTAREFRAQEV